MAMRCLLRNVFLQQAEVKISSGIIELRKLPPEKWVKQIFPSKADHHLKAEVSKIIRRMVLEFVLLKDVTAVHHPHLRNMYPNG
ncbi:hypothetical protein QE152_g21889 [Popillia japonica]|uniref:Uncharacterized protein n=1 Tax=Popillia japonica TaxID=7064 RepID=A0AAW1KNY7_POPJA